MTTKAIARRAYEKIASGNATKYVEKVHCPLVIEIISKPQGSIAKFCSEVGIGDSSFWRWNNSYPIFNECYRLAMMMSMRDWEREGEINHTDPDWNEKYWNKIGTYKFKVGKTARISLAMDHESNPWDQFKQLVRQANLGELTASEFKQLSEAVNVGTRAYETFEMQQQVDEMKRELLLMQRNDGAHIRPVEGIKKAN